MALITTWATLKSEVAAMLHRTGDTTVTDEVPLYVQLGEERIYRDLRVRQMETTFSSAISSGVIALPTGYRELKSARIDGTPVQRLTRKDAEWVYAAYPTRSATGKPEFIARDASNFIFGPYPDSAYTVAGTYYKRLDLLSDSNTSNWLITDVPDLIYFAALCEAADWTGNMPKQDIWERKYERIMRRVQEQDDQEEFSGSPIAVTAR